MRIKIVLVLLIGIATGAGAQTLKSPEVFLGYKLGERFTQHYKIVSYFQQAAAAMPQMMRLEQYGATYEGRPLLLAVVSTEANISNLDEIRKNNLRLSGLLNDKPADTQLPAIVWLSYNVHGNEASSSEVSMKTLYELLAPANVQTKEWLKNTVIIIDPCLNPDGRDRYVNWYTETVGRYPNTNGDAWEHNEPWPGGRSNHYNFDLNRDWAWQTQVETQERLKKYNEWMPVIHCDFHEQMPGNPYYFAPAAEPFHEVITTWQRSFQGTMGMNHAKYFDAHGWLYFTKEYFDLFYPAYGDTYPIYNGAIGMTYEQAGHGRGGLALEVNADTLRLTDRIEHHFTTSMSTIEVASLNAAKLNTEFKKYFDEGKNNGNGIYKTYVVSGANANKVESLKELFARNNIIYAYPKQASIIKGYNYFTGKEENYTMALNDLVISSYQPKSTLIKVLFEPQSKLNDSATYDITAWALPYAYGLQSYAVKERITAVETYHQTPVKVVLTQNEYGYLIEYNSFSDGKLMAALIKNNIKTRFAEKEFSFNGKKYSKGTLVILRAGNEAKISMLVKLTEENKSKVTPVSSGYMESGFDFGSEKLHLLKKPVVAMITGDEASSTAAGEVWHLFDKQLDYPLTRINSTDIKYINWKNIDVLIIPDGNYKILADKDASADLKAWVRQGGKLIAMEGAVAQMTGSEWGIKKKKEEEDKKEEDKKPSYTDLKKYENREKDYLMNNVAGAIYKTELDETHPLAFGYPAFYFSLKINDNILEFMKDGWNVAVIKTESQVSGFVGSKVGPKIKDGTVIAVQPLGRGSVIYFTDDPIFRSFWENGKLMFTNAVFLVGQ